ncbi:MULTISPECIES: glucokinase [Methylobacterium]|uniref:Glucokinase n=3 Tax=Pseudomonadota TaxID=1224 RepID=A0ABQ4SUV5_9HYPH|nr:MULTISPECIES: glucokinase [Methylobacterium]PIU07865.1 MAG: glucokinase [Methylobacterium sp. CG09_land_8_20_14_0_10_71_15]PIU11064.1 MAG: glucokinase [Methylobacterium sp. CG08_land_8_20_14_0_20_71_15]GBU16026.1 glucokinase [Methylobacterium sp.]GJE05658.1 Glucokinase [Methylobacterium jeotgali]
MVAFPVLVGDIGGTNARFALVEEKGAAPRLLSHEATVDHPDPSSAVRASLAKDTTGGRPPRSAILAVAARVDGPRVQLTNAHWVIEGERIGRDFGLESAVVVNDYVPVAAGAAGIAPDDLTPVGPCPKEQPGGARLVLGPGTGFGAAALVPYADRLAIVSTEAGHTDLGPSSEAEAAFWGAIERVEGRVTVETLLSGPGLARLHQAVASLRTGRPPEKLDPAAVTERGLSGEDPHASEALDHFATLLGRVCGDLALTFLATGGVYIGGGIAPRILPVLGKGGFRRAFEAKAPFAAMMEAVPTSVITVQDPAFNGLAALASESDRFVYHGQVWRAG